MRRILRSREICFPLARAKLQIPRLRFVLRKAEDEPYGSVLLGHYQPYARIDKDAVSVTVFRKAG